MGPNRQQKVGHGLFEKQKPGAEEEKHVEVKLEVEKEPGPPGEEDEINVKLDVTVDPENPDKKPMATEVKAKVLAHPVYRMQTVKLPLRWWTRRWT